MKYIIETLDKNFSANTLDEAYNFICNWFFYHPECGINDKSKFIKDNPFNRLKKIIENRGCYNFYHSVITIKTVDYYVNNLRSVK